MNLLWDLVLDLYSPAMEVMEIYLVDFPHNSVLFDITELSHVIM